MELETNLSDCCEATGLNNLGILKYCQDFIYHEKKWFSLQNTVLINVVDFVVFQMEMMQS